LIPPLAHLLSEFDEELTAGLAAIRSERSSREPCANVDPSAIYGVTATCRVAGTMFVIPYFASRCYGSEWARRPVGRLFRLQCGSRCIRNHSTTQATTH
jgi:hypothetical protein